MGNPEHGGDINRGVAAYVAWQLGLTGSPTSKGSERRRFLTLGKNPDEPISSRPEVVTESVVTASLDATFGAAVTWGIQQVVILLANGVQPGLGHLIDVALKFKEVWDDISALARPDRPRDLHIPLLGAADGIEFDLNVHLPGRDGTADDVPLVSGFVAPGNEGLFGGWQIEIDRRAQAAEREAPPSEPDTWTVLAASTAGQTEQTGSHGLSSPTKRTFSFATPMPTDDPLRAATMRETASRLRSELYARPEFRDEAIIVIHDQAARHGMWLVKPESPEVAAQRRIEIWLSPETGMTTVYLR